MHPGWTVFALHYALFATTALSSHKVVLTLNCPYSQVSLQSERSDWLPIALSLYQECYYIKCPCEEKLLYLTCASRKVCRQLDLLPHRLYFVHLII